MPFARSVNGVAWELPTLDGNEPRSRLLGDLTDPDDVLSVWAYSGDDELDDIVVAVAVTRQKLDRLDVIPIPEALCNELNIVVDDDRSDDLRRRPISAPGPQEPLSDASRIAHTIAPTHRSSTPLR